MNSQYDYFCPLGTTPYAIEPGDTLYSLGLRFNTTVEAIISANPHIDHTNLMIGEKICIPIENPYFGCRQGNYYEIKPGDTIYSISRNYNISVDEILEANPNINPDRLLIGQLICIPISTLPIPCPLGTTSYTIRGGDTFYSIARRYNVSLDRLIEANPSVDPDALLIGQEICIP